MSPWFELFQQFEGGTGRPPGGILVCDRVTVAGDKSPVAALRDGAAEAFHDVIAQVIERGADSRLIFGIESEECRGVEDLGAAGQHRHLAPLGSSCGATAG